MIMVRRRSIGLVVGLVLLMPVYLFAQGIPTPVRIVGTLTVDGAEVPGTAGGRYRFEVTDIDGQSYEPPAVDEDGLNDSGIYLIDIPVFDAATQPGGARLGETAVMHVFEDGAPLTVISPPGGEFMVERPMGTSMTLDITAEGDTPANDPPVASASGPAGPVSPGDRVILDGSASTDPDPDDTLIYRWEQITDADLTLSSPEQVRAEFTVPEVGTENNPLVFQLTVTDEGGLFDTDRVEVTVAADVNQPPVADAGDDQTVRAGERVDLDGTGSADADGRIGTYQWVQTDGPTVDLRNDDTATPFFTAPEPEGDETLRFRLTVADDEGAEDEDTVEITISPAANVTPVAVAEAADTVVEEGSTITLDAGGSSDPDGFIGGYRWRRVGDGPAFALSDPRAEAPTFVAPAVDAAGGAISLELTVTDNEGLTDTDTIEITVMDNGITRFPEEAISFRASTDREMAVEVNDGEMVRLLPDPPVGTGGAPRERLYGEVETAFVLDAPGTEVDFVLHLSDPAPEGHRWFRYRSGDGWQTVQEGVSDLDGGDRFRMILADGGEADGDRAVNGRFSAVLSLGTTGSEAEPSVDTLDHDNSGETNNCFISGASAGAAPTTERPSVSPPFHWALLAALLLPLITGTCRRRSKADDDIHGS